jgi:nucleoside-diphosphate-sugar epimerase
MTDSLKTIVITGANSPLGSAVVRHLLSQTDHLIIGIVSPRSSDNHNLPSHERLTIVVADLAEKFQGELNSVISAADRILHFAWVRENNLSENISINKRIVDNIIAVISEPDQFAFISSVGASPIAKSDYGISKWRVSDEVLKIGGVVLVCGLVRGDPPQGPDRLLVNTVKRFPLKIRFFAAPVAVFSTTYDELCSSVTAFVNQPSEPGMFRLFTKDPMDLNDFLKKIEARFPRARLPIPVPTNLFVGCLIILKVMRLNPGMIVDKLLTFLVKDKILLSSLKQVPRTNQDT